MNLFKYFPPDRGETTGDVDIAVGSVAAGVLPRDGSPYGRLLHIPGATLLRHRLASLWRKERAFCRCCVTLELISSRAVTLGRNDYVSLGKDALKRLVGAEDNKNVLRVLLEAGFIESDGFAIVGKKCFGYRLTAEAAAMPVELVEVEDAALSAFQAYKETRRLEAIRSHPAHLLVWDALQTAVLDPLGEALGPQSDPDPEKYARRRWHWFETIRRMQERDFFFSADYKAQRLHHTVSGMPKELRRYLRLNGEPCAETDLSNCQPLLMYRLYPSGSTEAARYAELVEAGLFYETLAAASRISWPDRDELKRQVYIQILYDRVRSQAPLWIAFQRAFPEMAAIIAELKRVDYRQLSIANQKAEADIVVRTVIPRLARELPGVPVLTVHDSLLIPERFAEQGRRALEEEVERAIGITPKVELKRSALTHSQERFVA